MELYSLFAYKISSIYRLVNSGIVLSMGCVLLITREGTRHKRRHKNYHKNVNKISQKLNNYFMLNVVGITA